MKIWKTFSTKRNSLSANPHFVNFNITFNHWCYEFSECWLRPWYRQLSRERNYCLTCQLRIIYNINKIYKIEKIPAIFNTYIGLRNDLVSVSTKVIKNFSFMIIKQEKENLIQFTINIWKVFLKRLWQNCFCKSVNLTLLNWTLS